MVNAISVTTGSLARGSSIVTLSSVANPLIRKPAASASAIFGVLHLLQDYGTEYP